MLLRNAVMGLLLISCGLWYSRDVVSCSRQHDGPMQDDFRRERKRHESDFDERPHPAIQDDRAFYNA